MSPMSHSIESVHFLSKGVRCVGWLHRPENASDRARPAILMVHGWGGEREALLDPFIERFVELGFVVMTFDFRGWGESEGEPRHVISPWQRANDARSALICLRAQPGVDIRRLVLWGTSFGGGHITEIAATHPDLAGAIAHMPMLDGIRATLATPIFELVRLGFYAASDIVRGREPLYIPVVNDKGRLSSINRDGAKPALMAGASRLSLEYDNRVAARSVLTVGLYRPRKHLPRVRIPMLLIGGTRDTVAPFAHRAIKKANNDHLQVKMLDANHFEPYFSPTLDENLAVQTEFLKTLPRLWKKD